MTTALLQLLTRHVAAMHRRGEHVEVRTIQVGRDLYVPALVLGAPTREEGWTELTVAGLNRHLVPLLEQLDPTTHLDEIGTPDDGFQQGS
jgi:hypothetical protein